MKDPTFYYDHTKSRIRDKYGLKINTDDFESMNAQAAEAVDAYHKDGDDRVKLMTFNLNTRQYSVIVTLKSRAIHVVYETGRGIVSALYMKAQPKNKWLNITDGSCTGKRVTWDSPSPALEPKPPPEDPDPPALNLTNECAICDKHSSLRVHKRNRRRGKS